MAKTNLQLPAVTALGAAALFYAALTVTPGALRADPADQQRVSFSGDILPLLKWRCSSCHQPGGEGYEKSGLDLTSYAGVMKGTKFGPMVIPGDPDSSNLMHLLDWPAHVSPQLRMPHGKTKLSICDRDAIRTWIGEGAQNN